MLPYQLVPYHQYTLQSMVFALLLWRELFSDSKSMSSGYSVSATLPSNSRVSSSLLYSWLAVLGQGLRRRHSDIGRFADLSSVRFGKGVRGEMEEIYDYLSVLCPRGPPRKDALQDVALQYGLECGCFLIGTPSQVRRCGAFQ